MMAHFLTNLAGLSFRPKEAKEVVTALQEGAELNLVRDAENPYDNDAIQIWTKDGTFIGFVESVANPPIADLMDGGTRLDAHVVQTYPRTEDKGDKQWMHPLIRIDVVGEEFNRGNLVDAEGAPVDPAGRPLDEDIPF